MWAFELIDVEVEYEDGGVVSGLNVGGRLGDITALVGAPRSGKTTAVRLLAGEIRPRYGAALVASRDVSRARGRDLKAIRRRLGTLMEGYEGERALITHMTVRDNVELAVHRCKRVPSKQASSVAREELARLDLLKVADVNVSALGLRRRKCVGLAKLFATRTPLALVDGIDSGLKFDGMDAMCAAIRSHAAEHGTSWLITMRDPRVAELVADEVETLGRMVTRRREPARRA